MRLNYAKLLIATFLAAAPTALASTTWYVDGVSGNDANNCLSSSTACKTIGHAISFASSGDSIMVAAATYTENLTIGFSLTITGSAVSTTIIDGGGIGTVVTSSSTRAHVTLSNVTIRNGLARLGAGILNYGTLTINNATVSNNLCEGKNSHGGGILNGGSLTINKSTIRGNSVYGFYNGLGGGIRNSGTLTINNSTVSGNSTSSIGNASGGGIYNEGNMTINNSTISGNSASNYRTDGSGGGIYNYPGFVVTLQNSIVANSPKGGNCSGSMNSDGYNLSSDNTCDFDGLGDLNNIDPKLGPLQNNGGPTQTQALLSGSPAIDAGKSSGCTDGHGHLLKTDQRGMPRPDKEDSVGCDMGAYERQSD